MNIDEAFKKYTNTKKTKYGYQVDCVKGLFGVTAPTIDQALDEARHYFWQYFTDGEYGDDILVEADEAQLNRIAELVKDVEIDKDIVTATVIGADT